VVPYAPTDPRATWGLLLAIAGLALGLIGLLAGAVVLLFAGGDLASNYALEAPVLNAFAIGIPALGMGPAAYFMGKSALLRITESQGKVGGSPIARAATWVGVAATVGGAASTLLWLVITLLGVYGPPPG
jgi:hypothetical protein